MEEDSWIQYDILRNIVTNAVNLAKNSYSNNIRVQNRVLAVSLQTINNASQIHILSYINSHSDKNDSTDSLNLEQVQSDLSSEINSNNTPKQ
ncbi:19272_t:CDS:2, partial [Cetraspora pellucida]